MAEPVDETIGTDYRCFLCKEIKQRGQGHEAAKKEYEEVFKKGLDEEPVALVCDKCYKAITKPQHG